MAPADPCLEFMTTHLRSGTWHSIDGSTAPLEFRNAAHVPGTRMVYGDGIDSSVVQAMLLKEPPAQRGQMVHQPRSAFSDTLGTDGALALANQVRMNVRLPASPLLDLTHPLVQPVDPQGRTAAPESATHVLVLPENHLANDLSGFGNPQVTQAPSVARETYLSDSFTGLVIGDRATFDNVEAMNPRFAPDEYPIFMHGALLKGQQQDAITDILNGLGRDALRASGKNIVLVVCDVAISPNGLNDAATALFSRLPAEHPKLTAFPTATLLAPTPSTASPQLSEVVSTSTGLSNDGRFGLVPNLIRTYTDAPEAPATSTGRTPMVQMHAPVLSSARGPGVAVTDRAGQPLTMNKELEGQLRSLGDNSRAIDPATRSLTFMYGPGYGNGYGYGYGQYPPPPPPPQMMYAPPPPPPMLNLADPGGYIARMPVSGTGITGPAVMASWNMVESRLSQFGYLWQNPRVQETLLAFKHQLNYELYLRATTDKTNAQISNDVNAKFGSSRVGAFTQTMAELGALSVPQKLWKENQYSSNFPQWLAETREYYADRLALWGKLNPAVADRVVEPRNQRILESTPLGVSFDNVLFGLPNYGEGTPGYFQFWADASHHLVNVSTGTVVAHVFEGVMRGGVLDLTEVPALLDRIKNGFIKSLVITVWKLDGTVLVPDSDITIHTRNSYDANAPILNPGELSQTYWSQQSRLYMQKVYRSAELNRQGIRSSYAEILEPLEPPAGSSRRGGFSGVHPIFVLQEAVAKLNSIVGEDVRDLSGRRRSIAREALQNQMLDGMPDAPVRTGSFDMGGLADSLPPLQRVPTGAGVGWGEDYGFAPGNLQRTNTTQYAPDDMPSSSSSSSRRSSNYHPSNNPSPPRALPPRDSPPSSHRSHRSHRSEHRSQSNSGPSSGQVMMPPPSRSRTYDVDAYGRPKDRFSTRHGAYSDSLVVHPDPGSRVEYLTDRPGATLFGPDQASKAALDRNLLMPSGVYQFAMEGMPGAGLLDGQKVTPAQVKDLIVADPRFQGQDIALVDCDPAFPIGNALDTFLVDLWKLLMADPRWNPLSAVFGGVGNVDVRVTAGGPGEVVALNNSIGFDGRIRLNAGGFRSVTQHPSASDGAFVPMLRQHGVTLVEAVHEARSGGGISLTDPAGNLVALSRTDFLVKGLNDPVHLQNAVDQQPVEMPPGASTGQQPAEAMPTWELWKPANLVEVRPNVFSANSHVPVTVTGERPETREAKAYYDGLALSATKANPIVDVGVGKGLGVLPADVAAARLMLEQFAQRRTPALLSTRGKATDDLLDAIMPYGAPLIHQTLAKGGLGGLNLGSRFTFTVPRSTDRVGTTPEVAEGVTAGLLQSAREMAKPTAAIKLVNEDLAKMIWAADLGKSKEQFNRAGWSPEQMTQHLGEVSAMAERVGNLPKVAIIKPVLEFGAVGHADLVFDYGMTGDAQRAGHLMDSLGKVQAAGKLGTGAPDALTTDHFASMVAAAGTVDLSLPTLGALGAALTSGNLDAALTNFDRYKGQFSLDDKVSLVEGLDRLKSTMPEQVDNIQRVMQTVLSC
ncbi:hypothetical protein [Actinoplanes sp. NPDC051494]|uniref:hypothetical protein n=1 Tax=Actinoplanes sp. NPDC051494 TaxID=3363907 RepID=UPI00379B74B2